MQIQQIKYRGRWRSAVPCETCGTALWLAWVEDASARRTYFNQCWHCKTGEDESTFNSREMERRMKDND